MDKHDEFLDAPAEKDKHDEFLDAYVEPPEPSKLKLAGEVAKDMFGHALDFMKKEGLSIAGMAAGAAPGAEVGAGVGASAGFLVGGPPGAWAGGYLGGAVGAMGGAALGGAAGKAVTEAGEAAYKAVKGQPGKSPEQVIENVKTSAKMGAEAEAFGLGIGMAGRAAKGALLPPLEARAPNVVRAVRSALSANILPTPAQIMRSKWVANLEEVGSKLPIIGKRIAEMRQSQEFAYDAMRKEALSKLGSETSPEALGESTRKTVQEHLDEQLEAREAKVAELHKNLLDKHGPNVETEKLGKQLDEIRVARTEQARKGAGKLYEELDKAIPESSNHVTDDNLRATAGRFLGDYKNLPKSTLGGDVRSLLEDMSQGPGGKTVENAAHPFNKLTEAGIQSREAEAIAGRKTYTFGEIQTLRSDLTSRIKQESMKVPRGQMTPEGRIYMNLKDAIDKDIESFSNNLPGDIKKLKDLADATWAEYKGTYANPTMATLGKVAKDNPEDVYRLLIKPGDVNDIRRLKNVVGEGGFVPLRRKFVSDLVTGPDGKMLSGPQITRNIAKVGSETMKEVLSPEQLKDLVTAAEKREMPGFVESEIETKLRSVIQQAGGVSMAPEEIVNNVLDADTVTIKALRNVVGEKGMQPYRRAVLEHVIGAPSKVDLLENPAANTVNKMTRNLASYGESLKYLFNESELADFQKIEDAKSLIESTQALVSNRPGTASSLASMAAGGFLLHPVGGSVFLFHNPIGAGATLLGADILSRFYVSKVGRQLLIDGLSDKAIGNTVLAARISAFAINARRGQLMEEEQGLGADKVAEVQASKPEPQPVPAKSSGDMSTETKSLLGL